MGPQNPDYPRRSVLASTPLAALTTAMPPATLRQMTADQEVIAALSEAILLKGAISWTYPHYSILADEHGFNAAMMA